MRYELRVAIRYLWAARRRLHTAFLALISMLGLAVGVATLLISLSLLSGLQGQIKSRLIAESPQLLVEPLEGTSIEQADAIAATIRDAGVRDVRKVVSGIAWAANRQEGRGRPAKVRAEEALTLPAESAAVSRGFAASLGLDEGSSFIIVAPRTRLTPFGPVPVWRSYTVSQILPFGGADDEAPDVLLPFDEAAGLFGTEGDPTSIEAFTEALPLAEELRASIERQFPAVLARSWREINRPLFLALRLEKIVMFATISLIILVAALNLISSLSMLIVEKRAQVGVLRTLGATERSILAIYLSAGLLIGLSGTLLGNAIGLGVSWLADRYGLVPLPGDLYYLAHIPFTIELSDVVSVNVIAVFLAVVGTLYPAHIASRLDPIVAIREE